MLKYAKVINEVTKQCEVGLGSNIEFYKSIGMIEMEIEQAYNGNYYVKGYCPEKPQEIINQERIADLEKYLTMTDWYTIRFADTGKEIPTEIKKARQDVREEISKLREEV